MKKLIIKDKNLRFTIKKFYISYYILKSIFKNTYLFFFIRQNANFKIKQLSNQFKMTSMLNRCVYSVTKKRFNKFSLFSRFLFIKLIQNGFVTGFTKHSR